MERQNEQKSAQQPTDRDERKARREFLKKAATVAATVPPATALLLDAASKPAKAAPTYRI